MKKIIFLGCLSIPILVVMLAVYLGISLVQSKQPVTFFNGMAKLTEKLGGSSAEGRIMQAILETKCQQYGQAEPILKSLLPLNLSPMDRAYLQTELADIDMHRGRYSAALEHLNMAEASSNALIGIYSLRGEALLKSGEPARSLAAFEKALAINRDYEPALFYKAEALELLGRLDEAAPLIVHALKAERERTASDDDNGDDFFLLGLIEQKVENRREATAAFEVARRLGYTYAAPYANTPPSTVPASMRKNGKV